MKEFKKKILKTTAILADANAIAKDKSTSFCPGFFYQPKRPKEKKNH
ncbi:MAG: cyclic lactone autoinducer peptide [Lachnospiraceae bacterium]|nr:cyclic lactone autoinducer peptide [Lachnospiraceae bacterium]